MNRRPFSLIAAGALLLIASCQPPAPNTNQGNGAANTVSNANANAAPVNHEAEVKKVMADLASALQANDAERAERFYSDDYFLITPSGVVQDRAARIADMKSGTTRFDTFTYDNIRVRSYGDVAVAISNVRAKGKIEGQDQDRQIMATLVMRRMPDGWKVVSGQATPIMAARGLPTPGDRDSDLPTPQATPPANTNK